MGVVGFLQHQGTALGIFPSSGAAGLDEGDLRKKKGPDSVAAGGPGILLGSTHIYPFSIDCLWALPGQTFLRYSGITIVTVGRHNGNGQVPPSVAPNLMIGDW